MVSFSRETFCFRAESLDFVIFPKELKTFSGIKSKCALVKADIHFSGRGDNEDREDEEAEEEEAEDADGGSKRKGDVMETEILPESGPCLLACRRRLNLRIGNKFNLTHSHKFLTFSMQKPDHQRVATSLPT